MMSNVEPLAKQTTSCYRGIRKFLINIERFQFQSMITVLLKMKLQLVVIYA